ncbi:hypothetical protein HYW58_02485 [Candidatus Kaiserbacteria bacterium]|nr:hypothetical protein [Candidatus Kaiserbacteria bacterium]
MYTPIWIIAIGVIVYFFWIKNKKELTPSLSDEKTSLNPLFSEKQISDSKKLFTNWQKQFEDSFSAFQKKEVEEIKKFQGKKEDFKPSDDLLNAIGRNTLVRFCTNFAKQEYDKMIESNISIINGEKISAVEEKFYDNSNGVIPYHNLSIAYSWDLYKRIFEKEYEKDVEQRKNYWRTSWDSIRREED